MLKMALSSNEMRPGTGDDDLLFQPSLRKTPERATQHLQEVVLLKSG